MAAQRKYPEELREREGKERGEIARVAVAGYPRGAAYLDKAGGNRRRPTARHYDGR
jgi:hypothetical protein